MQHSKCCVVSQPPWVQIPALPPLPPGPNGAGRFCYAYVVWGACCPDRSPAAARCVGGPGCLWPRWCSGRRRPRPPARLGGLTSFGAAPRSPPVPSGPSGALHTSGACRCEWSAWPGPATAHRHRGRSLQRPPLQWCQVSDVARCVGLLFGQAPPPPVGVTGVSCVEFLGWSGVCCYKRRQSDGFLAENGRYRSVRAMTSRKSRM